MGELTSRHASNTPSIVEFSVDISEFDEATIARKTLRACLGVSGGRSFDLVEASDHVFDCYGHEIECSRQDPAALLKQPDRFPLKFRMELEVHQQSLAVEQRSRRLEGCFQGVFSKRHAE